MNRPHGANAPLVIPYEPPVPPTSGPRRPYVWLEVRGPSRQPWPLHALVDSGADRSIIPGEFASVFGYRVDELRRGQTVRALSVSAEGFAATSPLKATVHGSSEHEFELDPIYVDGVSFALLGRRDFFLGWIVTFVEASQAFTLRAA